MAVRGCGASRIAGGAYLVTKLVRGGAPIEHFLIDPAVIVPEEFDLPTRGVAIRERPDGSGIFDVYDHVGEDHYPNVWDFVRETARHGLSRHVSKNINFSLLSSRSMIVLAHSRAVDTNAHEFYRAVDDEASSYDDNMARLMRNFCPLGKHNYLLTSVREGRMGIGAPTCAGLWVQDVKGGEDIFDPAVMPRTVQRTIGDTVYSARKRPDGVTPEYQRGFFLRLPLSGIEVVKSKDFSHEATMGKAAVADLPIWEVNE